MKRFSVLPVALATAVMILAAAPVRAESSGLTYRKIAEASSGLAGAFARSGTVRNGDLPTTVRIDSVSNETNLHPVEGRVETLIRHAIEEDGRVSVAADGSGADLVLQPTLRIDESGNYALSFSVTDASTGVSVWNGSLGMARAPAQAVTAPAQGGVASLPPGPPPNPKFVGGAAKTWDEWFDRGIESVGYHPPGSPEEDVRPARKRDRGTPQETGFLGRSSVRFGGGADFHSAHDFHHCRAGRGGYGWIDGTVDLRLNFADYADSLSSVDVDTLHSLDFVAHAWYKSYLDDPYAGLGRYWREHIRGEDLPYTSDKEFYGADLRLQWSFAPGEWFNPYLGAGIEFSRMSKTIHLQWNERWYDYETDEYYRFRKGKHTKRHSCSSPLFEVGLEINLCSRFSLRGDFTYYRKSNKVKHQFYDFFYDEESSSRKLLSAEANLRMTEQLFLSVGGAYETKDRTRSVNIGLGWLF